jgi:hypothetical protein
MKNNDINVNFMLVGAAKSGSSTLASGLSQHPDVYISTMKEPHFFSGIDSLVNTTEDYLALYNEHKNEKAIGEASTSYLFIPETASKIVNVLGKIKILIILRNPVARAYSNWFHMSQHKNIENLSFEDALSFEEERNLNKEALDYWPGLMYFRTGLYFQQVKRYFDKFGRENVKVIIFERFIANPNEEWKKIYKFLGVDDTFVPASKKENSAHQPKNLFLYNLISPPPKFFVSFYEMFPSFIKVKIFSIVSKFHRSNRKPIEDKPEFPLEIKTELNKKYRTDIRYLRKLLGDGIKEWD